MSEKEKLQETLSALFDNEAGKVDQLELRRLVRSLDDHPELIETYQRYMRTRAALKGESISALAPDLLGNVRAALEQEAMEEFTPAASMTMNQQRVGSHRLGISGLKALGRIAIAASVAVVAVYVVQDRLPVYANPVAVQVPVSGAVSGVPELLVEHNNRLLNPNVMTVSAGDRQPFERSVDGVAKTSPGCMLSAPRLDSSELVWEIELPAGYVLCKQNQQTQQCESVVSKIGCYLN